jgi:chemotaxis protein methyltransferase CheR
MSDSDYLFIAKTIQERVGIVLGETKRDMVYGRLARRLRILGISSFEEYCTRLKGPDGEAEIAETVNSLTTNLTKFFREPHHFEDLARDVLGGGAGRAHSPRGRLRIWSAGCSSGQEPFSVAITIAESMGLRGLGDTRILATDIDANMLNHCRSGSYAESQLAGLSVQQKANFLRDDPSHPGHMMFKNELRALIRFNKLNLLDQWPVVSRKWWKFESGVISG